MTYQELPTHAKISILILLILVVTLPAAPGILQAQDPGDNGSGPSVVANGAGASPSQIYISLKTDPGHTGTADTPDGGLSSVQGIEGLTSLSAIIGGSGAQQLGKARLHQRSRSFLQSTYRARVRPGTDVQDLLDRLNREESVAYAEPVPDIRLFYQPNDPRFPEQHYLEQIEAPSAWDSVQGDSSVVIAIVDTGTDMDHPDLQGNFWRNPDESENGQDDDSNGKVDDIRGWDFVEEDNDPSNGNKPNRHGTHVAGIAAARTDDGTGVASTAFNATYMPVKIADDWGNNLDYGYEAILYASLQGADVINCSWGSPGYSRTADSLISHAMQVGDPLIVAAAGNENNSLPFYPAAFSEVLAVSAVQNSDAKADFSSYGTYADLAAPGVDVLSTMPEGEYERLSGTSMASPAAASVAGLVKAAHPDFDSNQLRAQLVTTADDAVEAPDLGSPYLMGSGRVNARKAIGEALPGVEVLSYSFDDEPGNGDGIFERGEKLHADLVIKNFGVATQNATINLSPIATALQADDNSIALPALGHGEADTLEDIRFTVGQNADTDEEANVVLEFDYGNGRTVSQVIQTRLLPSYANLTFNNIQVSVDGSGHVGYTDYPDNTNGFGFIVNEADVKAATATPLLREGGLLFGDASRNSNAIDEENQISDAIRSGDPDMQSGDLLLTTNFRNEYNYAARKPYQKSSVLFSDGGAGQEAYNISVRHEAFAFGDPGHNKYILLSYRLTNDSDTDYSAFHAGLFFDFDLPLEEGDNDHAEYDYESQTVLMSEMHPDSTNDQLWVAATLADSLHTAWIIDNANPNLSEGVFEFGIEEGFTETEKWQALSFTGFDPNNLFDGPANLSFVISDSMSIARGASRTIKGIVAYGLSRQEALDNVEKARQRAAESPVGITGERDRARPSDFSLTTAYPNPFNPRTRFSIKLDRAAGLTVTLYNVLGQPVKRIFEGRKQAGVHPFTIEASQLSSGVYMLVAESQEHGVRAQKVTLVK